MLADTLRTDGSAARYPERGLAGFGGELRKAVALSERFYAPGFSRRMVRYAARSEAIRTVMGDLVLGEQGYLDLKRRLLRAAPRFVLRRVCPGSSAPPEASGRIAATVRSAACTSPRRPAPSC